MIFRHHYGRTTWIDLESPTRDELRDVLREFDVDAGIEHEVITPTPYPLFVSFSDHLYAILHFPTALAGGGAKDQEIDFIIGKDYLITCRYEVIDSIYSLHRAFEAEDLISATDKHMRTAFILERLLRRLYGALARETEDVAQTLDRIERDIFSGRERVTVRKISEVGRTLLRFETALIHHDDVLISLLSALSTTEYFGKSFAEHATHIRAERDHAAHLVESYRAVAHELRDTNDSLLSSTQNEIIKKLTIITFVTFPPILIAGMFGMNTDSVPLVGHEHGFWIILSMMVVAASLVFLYFRIRRWL